MYAYNLARDGTDPRAIADLLSERQRATLAWLIENWPYPYRGSPHEDVDSLVAIGLLEPYTADEWGGPTSLGRGVWKHARKQWRRETDVGAKFKYAKTDRNRAMPKSKERRLRSTVHAKDSQGNVYMLLPTFAYSTDYSSETGSSGGVLRVRIASAADPAYQLDDSGRLVSRGTGPVGYVFQWGDGSWSASSLREDGRDPVTRQAIYRVAAGLMQSQPTRTRALDHLDWIQSLPRYENRAAPSEQDVEQVQTIARQLGGGTGRLGMMIGAHSFTAGPGVRLTFKFKARARNGANAVQITLEPSDTYRVVFMSARGTSVKLKGQFEDVYAEDLRKLFERETGLYLSL